MKSVFIVLLSSMLFHVISANPGGAPKDACISMTPAKGSHGADPQTGVSPYNVTVNQTYYMGGKPVNVTIKSADNSMFKGILVQAREEGKETPIGTFSDTLPTNVKHLECTNPKDSVTHSARLNINSITLQWYPPAKISGMGNISFLATVVKDKATFWIKQRSPELTPMRDMPMIMTTTVTMQMSTYQMALVDSMTSMMINTTRSMPMPEPSSSMHTTTCPGKKCVANASPPNLFLLVSSAFILLLASTIF